MTRDNDFSNWDKWKEKNRAGLDWDVYIKKDDNKVTVTSSNAGIHLTFTSVAKHDPPEVYLALTGDQVAITNIKIHQLKNEKG